MVRTVGDCPSIARPCIRRTSAGIKANLRRHDVERRMYASESGRMGARSWLAASCSLALAACAAGHTRSPRPATSASRWNSPGRRSNTSGQGSNPALILGGSTPGNGQVQVAGEHQSLLGAPVAPPLEAIVTKRGVSITDVAIASWILRIRRGGIEQGSALTWQP
jgi:hypothetical protein